MTSNNNSDDNSNQNNKNPKPTKQPKEPNKQRTTSNTGVDTNNIYVSLENEDAYYEYLYDFLVDTPNDLGGNQGNNTTNMLTCIDTKDNLESRYRYLSSERIIVINRLRELTNFRTKHNDVCTYKILDLKERMFKELRSIETDMFTILGKLYPTHH